MKEIIINSKDVDLGTMYVFSISRDQAEKVINSKEDDVIDLGGAGNWIHIKKDTIAIRENRGGGRADLNKKIVLKQIVDQLSKFNEF